MTTTQGTSESATSTSPGLESTPPDRVPALIRLGMLVLAVPGLITGGWAVLDPRGWYDNFPGFGPMLVAAEPPYNAHLATDAGAGLLAIGAILAVAAVWADRNAARLALVGVLVFGVAHLIYHAANPAPGLSATQNTVNVIVLVAGVVVTVVLLLAAGTSSRRAPDRR